MSTGITGLKALLYPMILPRVKILSEEKLSDSLFVDRNGEEGTGKART